MLPEFFRGAAKVVVMGTVPISIITARAVDIADLILFLNFIL